MFLIRCFLGGYMPVGFELGSEITYPEPEGTTAGLVILGTQILSVFHAMAYSWMVRVTGDMWANTALTVTLFIGTGLTYMIPSDLRRQEAHKTNVLLHA
jgi:FLVCR family feline leukemia virus subgroup C receptor-related protein